jgi:hypothetical protein
MKNTTLVLAFSLCALLVAPLACLADGPIGCDFRKDSVNGPEPRCQERSGIQASTAFGPTCATIQGETLDDGCPRSGAVAGCDISGDGTVVDWYYAPKTKDDVTKDCADDDGKLVAP